MHRVDPFPLPKTRHDLTLVQRRATRAWGLILALYILGPGVMVEMLMKPLWGRVRPRQVIEFGGSQPFSPPNELVGSCTQNCSFVSGEVSGATVTALAILLMRGALKHRPHSRVSTLLLALALCLPLAVAVQRVAAGRHFLSDIVFAVLFTLLLALALSVPLRPFSQRGRQDLVWHRLKNIDAPVQTSSSARAKP